MKQKHIEKLTTTIESKPFDSILPSSITQEEFEERIEQLVKQDKSIEKSIIDSPLSFFGAIWQSLQLGFVPNSEDRKTYIWASKENGKYTCHLYITKDGMIDLAQRSGKIADIKVENFIKDNQHPFPDAVYAEITLTDNTKITKSLQWEDIISSWKEIPAKYNKVTNMFFGPYRDNPVDAAQKQVLVSCLQQINVK